MAKQREPLTVDLVSATNPQQRCGFELRHAERLLRLSWSGWVLPDNSPYTFTNGFLAKKPKKQIEE